MSTARSPRRRPAGKSARYSGRQSLAPKLAMSTPPDVTVSTRRRTSCGCLMASVAAMTPPIDCATRSTGPVMRASTMPTRSSHPRMSGVVRLVAQSRPAEIVLRPGSRAEASRPASRNPATRRIPAGRECSSCREFPQECRQLAALRQQIAAHRARDLRAPAGRALMRSRHCVQARGAQPSSARPCARRKAGPCRRRCRRRNRRPRGSPAPPIAALHLVI